MADSKKFSFEIGEAEKHSVEMDFASGSVVVKVDGQDVTPQVARQNSEHVYSFEVGQMELNQVKLAVEKHLFSRDKLRAYVNGRLLRIC